MGRRRTWTGSGLVALGLLAALGLQPASAVAGPKSTKPKGVAASPSPAPSAPGTTRPLLWSDEFDGAPGAAPDRTVWAYETGGHGWGNGELQTYTARAQNVALDGSGALRITARKETHTGADGRTRDWTSARLFTKGLREFQYGRVEARVKVPVGQGLWPAFWMLGHDNWTAGWPESGEIDVMETFNAGKDVYTTVHGPSSSSADGRYFVGTWTPSTVSYGADYHVYAVEWSASAISFSVDGRVVEVVTPTDVPVGGRWVFDKPFYVLLNLAVGGWPGPPDATTPTSASMLVDYVRVYR